MSKHSLAYYVVAVIGLVALAIDLFAKGDQAWTTFVVFACVILLVILRPGGVMKSGR
jgi:hypothetical protein